MPKESSLKQAEKDSLSIEQFIFHILITKEETPKTLSKVILTPEHRQFFCERIAESAEGTQFIFTDIKAATPERCNRMINKSDEVEFNEKPEIGIEDKNNERFIEESIGLAQDFLNHHKNNMSNGALIVALVNIASDGKQVPLISLIKMDNTEVLQYVIEENEDTGRSEAMFKKILNTFVENKDAVQKIALIDMGEHFKWDVLAQERNKQKLSLYFRDFLSITERETDSYWTRGGDTYG